MPYSADKPSELPSNVQKLTPKLQKLWTRTWNSVYARQKDEGAAFRIANKMVSQAKSSAEDEPELSDDEIESFVEAEVEPKPSRDFLTKLRDQLKGLKGKQIDDAAIDKIVRQSAGYAGGKKRHMNRTASEITDYNLLIEMAEAPDSFNVLPTPGTYKHPRYGNIKITKQRNQHFVDNFNNAVYQEKVPVDAEHETKLSGAMGWITELSMNDDGSVDASVEWTDRGTEAIGEDRYKYISPEWYDEWDDPVSGKSIKDVLIGAALTTRPFFKDPNLKPLVASELELEDDWDDVEQFAELPDDVSFDQLREQAYRQLREKYPVGNGELGYSYIADMSPSHIYYCDSKGKDFRAPYSLTDGQVAVDFTEAKPVERMTMWRTITASEKKDNEEDEEQAKIKAAQPDPEDVHVPGITKKKPGGNKMAIEVKDLKSFAEDESYKAASPEEQATWLAEQLGQAFEQVETANKAAEEAKKAAEAADTATVDSLRKMNEEQTARIASLETQSRSARFAAMAKDNQWIGERDKHVAMLEALATSQGEDSEIFKQYVEGQNALGKQFAESKVFGEVGHQEHTQETSKYAELLKAYREANPDKTEAEASTAVVMANPELYSEYTARQRKAAAEDRQEIVQP